MAETAHPGAHSILEHDHASAWLGISVLSVGEGKATLQMTLRKEMLNGFGMAHGGMVFAFADSAFALACNPATGSAETITVASGVDINFLRPAFEHQLLTAVAQRRSSAGRSGIYDIEIFAADPGAPLPGALIAEFRGRSRTIPRKKDTP
ncbi:hydroxyphenylacetyl-CoA thioesterase PaaI [Pseudarthrobacter sp. PS3-L1]|uniref:hydroxyphenylacetyl-CoA thioesterase PaaI n=1 Tax=Pseudarthrobacter sp. PS3-L1 TaxID=3046207 RepID=UPI0024BB87FD|nr:hydroxyphenylacetyl-CoA thioesterase PaaI [Pseudarthrobacter sp. PS3-L1]MDJ0319314.1 hydroxyphenylacetyl-CoA thioesterase PaaI [Pseudarthrobacter sp. PS3-L1]